MAHGFHHFRLHLTPIGAVQGDGVVDDGLSSPSALLTPLRRVIVGVLGPDPALHRTPGPFVVIQRHIQPVAQSLAEVWFGMHAAAARTGSVIPKDPRLSGTCSTLSGD